LKNIAEKTAEIVHFGCVVKDVPPGKERPDHDIMAMLTL
jgi:hypothetical protein